MTAQPMMTAAKISVARSGARPHTDCSSTVAAPAPAWAKMRTKLSWYLSMTLVRRPTHTCGATSQGGHVISGATSSGAVIRGGCEGVGTRDGEHTVDDDGRGQGV
jgi:hypothetical protein